MERKHLFMVIGVLIIAFGVYAYYYPPTTQNQSTLTTVQFADAGKNSMASGPSKLRMNLIEEMVVNYRQIQLQDIEGSSQNPVKDDAHSILFDLDTLKKFINDIEVAVKKNQPTVDHKLAIRMYYAAYPLNSKWNEPAYRNLAGLLGNDITKLYERKHTLIMIPVIKNKIGIFADFNPLDINTYNGLKRKETKGMQFLSESDTTEIPALNHGQLIPPASNQGEAF